MRPMLIARLALVPLALLEFGIAYFFVTRLPPSPPTYSLKRIAFLVLYLTAVMTIPAIQLVTYKVLNIKNKPLDTFPLLIIGCETLLTLGIFLSVAYKKRN
jgi:hypothetical protein